MNQNLYDFKKKAFQSALRKAVSDDADPEIFKQLCLGYARINKLDVPVQEARIAYDKINDLLQIVYELSKMRPLKQNGALSKLKADVESFAETAQRHLSKVIVEFESLMSEVNVEEEEQSDSENTADENKY